MTTPNISCNNFRTVFLSDCWNGRCTACISTSYGNTIFFSKIVNGTTNRRQIFIDLFKPFINAFNLLIDSFFLALIFFVYLVFCSFKCFIFLKVIQLFFFFLKRADNPKSCSFNCSHYRNNAKEKCTPHRIREVVPDELLLEELRRITYTARTRERQFAEFINKKAPRKTDGSLTPSSVNMKGCQKGRQSLMHCSNDYMRTMFSAG